MESFHKKFPVLLLMLTLTLGLLWMLPQETAASEVSGCEEEHQWGPWREEVASDCYTEGVYSRECLNCGEVERIITAPSHNYNYQVTITDPTCAEIGMITYTCQCGDSYALAYGDALGHDLVCYDAQEATCETAGWAAYEACTRCDYSTYVEIPATGHNIYFKSTEPTCTEPGYDIYFCINCGIRHVFEDEAPWGHEWSEWEVREEFAERILQHRWCWVCDEQETQEMAGDYLCGGTCGENLLWTLGSDGTLTVFGTGHMKQYYGTSMPWINCLDLIKKVVVEDGVTLVSWGAFNNCPNLQSAEIAGSVIYVSSDVFQNCGALTTVKLGYGMTEIGANMFYRCFKLREIEIPDSITWIGGSAFFNCESLETLTIPASVTSIGEKAFINCNLLKTITFLGDAPSLGEDCFYKREITVYYPADNETWTEEVRQDYGGTITWIPVCSGEHSYGNWTAMMSPTCTLGGWETRYCGRCQYSQDRVIPAYGHTWGGWTSDNHGQVRACGTCDGVEHIYNAPQASCNIHKNFYPAVQVIDGVTYRLHRRWALPITSAMKVENGGYIRVECVDGILVIETYDDDLNFLSGRSILLELPIYGGVYLGEDYNFVVSGQENREEDDRVEVIRVTRYTKDWVKLDHTSLYGANTTEPFNSGTLRFARSGDMLYIHTSHEMYAAEDRFNHQANLSLRVYIPTMEITDSSYMPSYSGTGYVSHSFNQFVLVDGDDVITLDQGDAYPRAVVLYRSKGSAGDFALPFYKEEVEVLKIADNLGSDTDTGVAVGGLVASSTHYIVVGITVDQSVYMEQRYGQRNIFITMTPKDDFSQDATQGYWLTHHPEGSDVELSQPYIVEVSEDKFLLIWTENDSLRHCFFSGQGELLSEIYENEGVLSDCVPILDGNRVLWYASGSWDVYYYDDIYDLEYYHEIKELPVFYQIDLADSGKVTPAKCDHRYESVVTEPTCTEPGYTTHTCAFCGRGYTDTPTAPLGHRWSAWEVVTLPTTEEPGLRQRSCEVCGHQEQEVLPAVEFYYGDSNSDGKVNAKDVVLLRQYLAGWDVIIYGAAADCNGDGKVNAKDVVLLRQYLAGWDVTLGQ